MSRFLRSTLRATYSRAKWLSCHFVNRVTLIKDELQNKIRQKPTANKKGHPMGDLFY